MKLAIVIPWREQASRRYAKHLVLSWYEENFPGAALYLPDTDHDPFNLAACRNAGVRRASGHDVVVVNDADTIPEKAALQSAIEAAYWTRVVHLPYTEYRSLRLDGTSEYLRGTELIDCDHIVVPGACSGVFVTTPETWWTHGGQDEKFRGWGFEDAAWYMAHKTLLGSEPARHSGRVYALHHESAVKEGPQYEANAARCYRYQQAEGDIDKMHDLVFSE